MTNGELLEIAIDASAGRQESIEDCQACCTPITREAAAQIEPCSLHDP